MKNRRFQFRLRTLLVFTAICAIPCAWLGSKIERKRKEREAVAAIRALGGVVVYDDDSSGDPEPCAPSWFHFFLGDNFFNEVVVVDFRAASDGDEDLCNLRGLTRLKVLDLTEKTVSSSAIVSLNGLTELEELYLLYTPLKDADFRWLKLPQLKSFGLSGSDISDRGLEFLRGMTNLERLDLHVGLTDDGLVNLSGTKNLRCLDLSGSKITDAGFGRLKSLTKLEMLDVSNTNVSDAGIKQLKASLPNCQINNR
jgi:Leucine-rich repeat (LRR) protein